MTLKPGFPALLVRCSVTVAALALVAGCSSVPNAVNPISWYRDLTGASKNDALDNDTRNRDNLAAGGQEPYPNLADVPNPPDRARSTLDRDALKKSLIADRSNASYTDQKLRAGIAAPGEVVPPVPAPATGKAAPATGTDTAPAAAGPQTEAAPPAESPLVAPTIASAPQGEQPAPPPPPPDLPPSPDAASPNSAANSPAPAATEVAPGKRRSAASSSVQVAAIAFADGSTALTDAERNQLSEIAAMQRDSGGAIRIIGHAQPTAGANAADRQIATFTLALNRAKTVAQVLSNEGVPAQSLVVEASPNHAGDAGSSSAEVFVEH